MKTIYLVSIVLLPKLVISQGSSCNDPYRIQLDSVSRSYGISSFTGNALHCTGSAYTGTGHVTIFQFTSNATGSCVLIDLTTSGYQPAEVLFYTKCSGGGALQNLEIGSSLCLTDGTGLWAPSETFDVEPNKTYFLRVWTKNSGMINLSARAYDPPNNFCSGATAIGPTPINDNNACNKPSLEVEPVQLCAFSLENTAFYKYTVDYDGVSVVQINSISCDNNASGSTAGFQIGFFTGNCGSLSPISCYSAVGGSVSAPTSSLPAGTDVYVAVDGMSGSNCTYNISAFNAVVVPVTIRYFTAWKANGNNILRWQALTESPGIVYEVEKSTDGVYFQKIGSLPANSLSHGTSEYSFTDSDVWPNQYYRLKVVVDGTRRMYSNIIRLERNDRNQFQLINPVTDIVRIKMQISLQRNLPITIFDEMGRQVMNQSFVVNKGENNISINVDRLSKGIYYVVTDEMGRSRGHRFIKL